jgi:hypothetical protein
MPFFTVDHVAQLEYFARELDTYIDKAVGNSDPDIYAELEKRLMNLKQLYTNAARYLDPIIQDAVTKER